MKEEEVEKIEEELKKIDMEKEVRRVFRMPSSASEGCNYDIVAYWDIPTQKIEIAQEHSGLIPANMDDYLILAYVSLEGFTRETIDDKGDNSDDEEIVEMWRDYFVEEIAEILNDEILRNLVVDEESDDEEEEEYY